MKKDDQMKVGRSLEKISIQMKHDDRIEVGRLFEKYRSKWKRGWSDRIWKIIREIMPIYIVCQIYTYLDDGNEIILIGLLESELNSIYLFPFDSWKFYF